MCFLCVTFVTVRVYVALSASKLWKRVFCVINLFCKITKCYSVVHKHNEELDAYKVDLGLLYKIETELEAIHI